VYECTRWHSSDGECKSDNGWEQINTGNVRTVPASWKSTKYSTAKFSVTPFKSTDNGDILQNAYIVGTSADLGLSNGVTVRGPERGRIATGEEVTVEGRIVSENENFVEGANVDVSFYRGDEKVNQLETAETDIEGRFKATGQAPAEPGNYSVKITAYEDNYNRFEKKFDNSFETFVREGVAVRTDSPVEVALGGESKTEVTVQNTGQTDMKDVRLDFQGIEAKHYSVSESTFTEIPAGEERTVELTFDLPGDYCGQVCETYPQLDISASAENADGENFESETNTLRTQITRTGTEEETDPGSASNQQKESSTTRKDTNMISGSFSESITSMENATGDFLASQSTLNIALGLIMVFTMVLAGAVKKKKDEGMDEGRRRGQRPAIQKPDLGGSKVHRPEPEVEEKEDNSEDKIDEVIDSIGKEVSGDVDEAIDQIAEETVGSEEQEGSVAKDEEAEETLEDSGDESEFACSICGEKFDSESGRDLHEQVMHEE